MIDDQVVAQLSKDLIYNFTLPVYLKMDEYKEVEREMQQIIDKRLQATVVNHQWDYNREVGKNLQMQPYKYQKVQMSSKVQFTDDIRKIIYNEKQFPDDGRIFTSSDWHLAPVTESTISPPSDIPSAAYLRNKKTDSAQADQFYGKIELQGKLKGKSNELNYNNYTFNLRSNALVIYKPDQSQGDKQLFYIPLNENTFDYLSDATDFFFVRGEQKNFKIFRDQNSKDLIDRLEHKLMYYSFRGAYAFRNQVPDWRVADYINQQIDTIGPINFDNENGIRDVVNSKNYRQAIGAFCKLLQKLSRKRKNKAGEINYPRWLKEQFRDMPRMQTWLSTNVIPPQSPLMSLKVKVNNNEKSGLLHSMKYVFPYLGTYLKRSLIVYESQLVDQQSRKILQNLSFPMHTIGFPQNELTVKSLQHAVHKSSDFHNQVLDFSHNKKLLTISGSKIINLVNSNPTIKKIHLKGCQIANGQQDIFFDALSSNLVLEQLQLDYHQGYNQSMVHYLDQFQAVIQ